MGCTSSKVIETGDLSGLEDPGYDDTMASLTESIDEIIAAEGYDVEGYWCTLSKNGKEDLKMFKKNCEILAKTKSMAHVTKTAGKPGQDPNKEKFRLRSWVKPSQLRPFLKNYEAFDTSLEDYIKQGNTHDIITDEEAHEFFTEFVSLHHNGEPLEMELKEGEAAWEVFKPDVFEKDEISENQAVLLKIRAQRKLMGDVAWKKQRRKELATYFVKRRKFTKEQVKPHLNWAKNMMVAYLKFLELC